MGKGFGGPYGCREMVSPGSHQFVWLHLISKLHVSATLGATWLTSEQLHVHMSNQVTPEITKSRAGTTFSNQYGTKKSASH